jgi:hypothetical protein
MASEKGVRGVLPRISQSLPLSLEVTPLSSLYLYLCASRLVKFRTLRMRMASREMTTSKYQRVATPKCCDPFI